jgi:hypothetical protein
MTRLAYLVMDTDLIELICYINKGSCRWTGWYKTGIKSNKDKVVRLILYSDSLFSIVFYLYHIEIKLRMGLLDSLDTYYLWE